MCAFTVQNPARGHVKLDKCRVGVSGAAGPTSKMACRMARAGKRVAAPRCSTSIIRWKATLANLPRHLSQRLLQLYGTADKFALGCVYMCKTLPSDKGKVSKAQKQLTDCRKLAHCQSMHLQKLKVMAG